MTPDETATDDEAPVDPDDRGPPLLRVTGLSKRFGRLIVLDDVSLALRPGEALGVVGPNGAGKSTMLNLLSGVLRADAGSVWLDGVDLSHADAATRSRAGIGRTYQIPRPFLDMTVFENVLVGATFAGGRRGKAAHEVALESLATAGLLHRANVPARALRLLDRKRLELARALATRPRLILLDEIAGGLTDVETPALVETVRSLRDGGVAVIWIEHIVHALVAVVDRLMCLAVGRTLAVGSPQEVLANQQVHDVYLGSTVEAEEVV